MALSHKARAVFVHSSAKDRRAKHAKSLLRVVLAACAADTVVEIAAPAVHEPVVLNAGPADQPAPPAFPPLEILNRSSTPGVPPIDREKSSDPPDLIGNSTQSASLKVARTNPSGPDGCAVTVTWSVAAKPFVT